MGCLSIVASSFCSSIDIIGFCTTASMQIQLNHRPSASEQHNSNRIMGKTGIEPIMFTTRERIYSPPQHRQSLPLSHNPDSRVSKVFNVLCLNTRRFGLRQHRLYGRTPLHGLDSTVQLYAHKEVYRHALTAMVRVGNCVRFSTSCILCRLNTAFSIKDTHPRKEESMKNVYVKWRQPLTNLPYEYILPQELQKVVVHVFD